MPPPHPACPNDVPDYNIKYVTSLENERTKERKKILGRKNYRKTPRNPSTKYEEKTKYRNRKVLCEENRVEYCIAYVTQFSKYSSYPLKQSLHKIHPM